MIGSLVLGEKRKPISFGGDSTGPKQGKVAAKGSKSRPGTDCICTPVHLDTGVAKQFGGMRMDQAAGTEGKKGSVPTNVT